MRYFLVRIVVYFIPAVLIAYGDHQIVINFFSDGKKQHQLETICFFFGILATIVLFPIIIEGQKKKLQNQSKMIRKVLKNFRDILNQNLSTFFDKNDLYLNVRIFLPQKGLKAFLAKKLKNRIYFEIHNFAGLFIEEVDNLTFQVSPKTQGLVGLCYKETKIIHDFNLKANQGNAIYNLKKSQIQKTDYCQFAIAAPIIKNDESIDAIITFDSRIKIDDPENEDWEDIIKEACKIIHLCKPIINYKNINYES